MSTNSPEIVQQIRTEFESLLQSVCAVAQPNTSSAYEAERTLLMRLLALGRMLLQLFFCCQSEQFQQKSIVTPQGDCLPAHSQKARSYWSVFGKVRIVRRYYYQDGQGYFPLDAALNLPQNACSDLLREWRQQLGVEEAYHKVGQKLRDILGQTLGFSTRSLTEMIAEDAQEVQAFYAQAPAPLDPPEASILVVQADGKGVPRLTPEPAEAPVRLGKGQKNGRKKEAIVSCVYTLLPWVRTPQEVVDSLFKTRPQPYASARPAGPQNKRWWATLEGKEAAIAFTRKQMTPRDTPAIRDRVALTDGSEPLQRQVQTQLPEFRLVLDIIHATEYLWEAANTLLGEAALPRTEWVRTRTLQILSGQTKALIAELRQLAREPDAKAGTRTVLERVAAYYERNLAFMHYDVYLACGWPIATGVIEGACRHLVKDRCELSGMRWSLSGAEALLRLRCVSDNGDWEAFHAFRRAQRQRDLYGCKPTPELTDLDRRACAVRLQLVDCQAA